MVAMFGFHHVLFRDLFQRFTLIVDSCLRGKGLFFKLLTATYFVVNKLFIN